MKTGVPLAALGFLLAARFLSAGQGPGDESPQSAGDTALFTFGAIADCQYFHEPGTGQRKYSLSDQKLAQCVRHLNGLDLTFVIHLGDFVDRDTASFDVVGPIFESLKAPRYHVLGNHDFSVADAEKATVPGRLNMPSRYYDFSIENWRFVVLDGNDISLHAYATGSEQTAHARSYHQALTSKPPSWNGAVGPRQLEWLKTVLEQATDQGEKVLLFCHFPVFPENPHNLWNSAAVLEIIGLYPCVRAYVNGHNHAGLYGLEDGVHYLTLKGMVDTEETSYATITVHPDRLEVRGFGREENRSMTIR